MVTHMKDDKRTTSMTHVTKCGRLDVYLDTKIKEEVTCKSCLKILNIETRLITGEINDR